MELVTGTATVEDTDEFLAELGAVGDAHGCTVQAFDARYVAGREHLRRALELADRAFERDENVARDRAVELLCRAAGRRQIDRALAIGVGGGTTAVAVVVAAGTDPGDSGGTPDERERRAAREIEGLAAVDAGDVDLGDPARLREFFAVGESELSATTADLEDLVLERVAMLTVEK